jgi:hypothetical protein
MPSSVLCSTSKGGVEREGWAMAWVGVEEWRKGEVARERERERW